MTDEEELSYLLKRFNLIIKHCYRIVWSIEKNETEKPKNHKNKKRENNGFMKLGCFCGSKKWRFIKEKDTSGILSSLVLRAPLSKRY